MKAHRTATKDLMELYRLRAPGKLLGTSIKLPQRMRMKLDALALELGKGRTEVLLEVLDHHLDSYMKAAGIDGPRLEKLVKALDIEGRLQDEDRAIKASELWGSTMNYGRARQLSPEARKLLERR